MPGVGPGTVLYMAHATERPGAGFRGQGARVTGGTERRQRRRARWQGHLRRFAARLLGEGGDNPRCTGYNPLCTHRGNMMQLEGAGLAYTTACS
jgi:hypothetical protein